MKIMNLFAFIALIAIKFCVLSPRICEGKRVSYNHENINTRQLAYVLQGGWKNVDLTRHNALVIDINKHIAKANNAPLEGHSGELVVERRLYNAIANMSSVNHICEIGFNAGHSASMWLQANTKATVTMFDIWDHPYAESALEYLMSKDAEQKHGIYNAPQRLRIIKGSSLITVPKFAIDYPNFRCDLISVDGGHTYDVAVADIANMRNLANESFNILLVDDTNCVAGFCVDEAIHEHEKRGSISVLQGYAENIQEGGYTRGVTVAKYNRFI